MKRLLVIAVFAFFGFNLVAQTEKELRAEIKHVTVFPDRAQINHEAAVALLPGKSILKFTDLSPYIDQQSVQVKGFGEFTILSVVHQNNYLQNLEDSPEVKSMRSQMEALQEKVEDEKAAINVLKEKGAFLTANRPVLVKETATTTEHFKSIMDLYTTSFEQVTKDILKKERVIREYEKQITALQQQISARLGKEQLPSGEVAVTVSSDKQVSGRLALSYVVTNAGWYPSYDVRVDNIKNPVSISYKANVFQNSGTPWKDVKLSFSNATPWVAGNVPVLYPWFVDYFNPPVLTVRGTNRKAEMAPSAVMEEVKTVAADEVSSYIPEVKKQIGETTITFDVANPYTIPSDNKVQVVEIQRLEAPADYKYVTLPKLSPLAYLTANVKDWAKLSLQSGEATLYFENSFVGKSYLNVDQTTDTLTISLGTDNSILVKREKRKDFTSTKIIGANKTEIYSFLLSVRNNKPTPVQITLKDQLPVSSNSGISVEALETSGGKYNSQTGELSWDLDIKPSETKQVIMSYSVKYPKDKKVILE